MKGRDFFFWRKMLLAGVTFSVLILLGTSITAAAVDPVKIQVGEGSIVENVEENEEEDLQQLQEDTQARLLEMFDFSSLNESLQEMFPAEKIRFSEVVSLLLNGEMGAAGEQMLDGIVDSLFYEFRNNRKNLVYILLIALIAAVFHNFSSAFQNRQVSDISFYVLYMLLITMCLQVFRIAMDGLEERVEMILDFMRVLCPSYFLAVSIATGTTTALFFYQLVLMLIFLAETVILNFLLPLIHLYIMVQVMDHLTGEEMLSEMGELLKKAVSWTLKTVIACVIGVNVIQGLLAPVLDSLKRGTVTKVLSALPGIGNAVGGMTEIAVGTAVLIKNGIGMAGAVILIGVCIVPVIQMAVLMIMYKIAAAVVQPVTDKRIVGCISSVSEGYELLLQVICTTTFLFLLTIAVVAASISGG